MIKKEGIRREEKIKKNKEFKKIFRSAKRIKNDLLEIYCIKSKKDLSRFAVILNKKIGNSVIRNRIKRIIREVFRKNKEIINNGNRYDWVILPKNEIFKKNFSLTEHIILDIIEITKRNDDKETNNY